jgi:hypothetical protein
VKSRRKRWLRATELVVGTVMTVYGLAGGIASQIGWVGKGEPKLVLHLSWAALFFAGLVGLIAAVDDG